MITHITVEDTAKLISWVSNMNKTEALIYIREAADRGEIQAADGLEKLQAENEKLRAENIRWGQVASEQDKQLDKLQAELKQVKRERDAAVEDVAAIIGDVEEIRRGYGVDNADADGAFAELCETYCANKGRFCYAECEKYHCKNFKWLGQKED